jgi:hypothetical protein
MFVRFRRSSFPRLADHLARPFVALGARLSKSVEHADAKQRSGLLPSVLLGGRLEIVDGETSRRGRRRGRTARQDEEDGGAQQSNGSGHLLGRGGLGNTRANAVQCLKSETSTPTTGGRIFSTVSRSRSKPERSVCCWDGTGPARQRHSKALCGCCALRVARSSSRDARSPPAAVPDFPAGPGLRPRGSADLQGAQRCREPRGRASTAS